jgi:hypothetical protein
MTRPDSGAQKRPPGDNPRGGDSGVHQILPVWATRGRDSHDPAPSPDPATTSPTQSTVQVTDEQAVAVCFDKKRLARFLGISVRSLDRANAMGLLPSPDLVVGPSPRWSPETISRWLRTRPKLPGRGRKGGGS